MIPKATERSAPILDATAPVRKGEHLPVDRLARYLAAHRPEWKAPLAVEQFPGGHSNLTYLLRVGDNELVLRRPPFGNQVRSAHDMGREFRVLSRLSGVYELAPTPYLYCEDESVIGAPFYLMERRRGVVLRGTVPDGLEFRPSTARRLARAFVANFARLHALDYAAAGLGDLGRPDGYVERQLKGWSERYARARTHDWPEIDRVIAWLLDQRPPRSGAALIHNDYKYDNILLDPHDLTRLRAVFDWEMSTLGDPLMDLGTTLAYWVEAGDAERLALRGGGPTTLPGNPTRRELVALYGELSGRDVSAFPFYYVFGLFKNAVIGQQIYYRYARGFTRDERFARMHLSVELAGRMAARAIETAEF